MDETCVRLAGRASCEVETRLGSHREVSFAKMALPHVQLENGVHSKGVV